MSARTRRRPATEIGLVIGAVVAATAVVHSDPPAKAASFADNVEHHTVFERGEDGYNTFRIPAIIQAENGDLLVFAEARVDNPSDDGNIDMVLKRSFDGGATWQPLQVLAGVADPNKWGNPVPMVDENGDLVLNMTRTGGNVSGADVRCGVADDQETRRSFMLYSDDDGATWGGLAEVTDDVRPDNWGHFVGGPGHGIRLSQGAHAGRLIVAGNHSIDPPPGSGIDCLDPQLLGAHILYSDDDGATWELGAVDQPMDTTGFHPHESTAVELSDGTIYVSSRDQRGASAGLRVDAVSSDGGETFDATFDAVDGVVTSAIQGSVITVPDGAGGERAVFSATGHPTARENLTLWSSFDDTATWQESFQVYDGPTGYSDLIDLDGQELGVLFENGERLYDEQYLSYSHRISFARMPVDLLDSDPPPTPVAPDVSANGHDGMVGGDPEPVAARFGSGFELAGDYVEIPLTDQTDVSEDEFTASMWFRTSSQENQALLWAYSRIRDDPKWWIRLEPGQQRIRALLDTGSATRSVIAPGDFADGTWHHIALTRGPTGIVLYVDGSPADSASALSGSLSANPRVGVRVGARVDGINNPMRGAVDEVRLFDSALSSGEVSTLEQQNTAPSADTVAHLPLDAVTCAASSQLTTPDDSGNGNDGVLIGCPESTGGVFDDGARLSYTDHVEVPNDPVLEVGDQPFTAAAWFRASGDADQTILWAYDWGSPNPQWWIRLEPGQQRIRANLNNGTSVVSAQAPGSYNDGEWHHVALTRDDNGVTLYVDGTPEASTAPISGSLSAGAQHGIHVGQRVDGANPLSGSVDEVWLLDEALTSTEVATLMQQNTTPAGAAQLYLPLDEVHGMSQPNELEITTVSGRPDTVTGGDSVVQIRPPEHITLSDVIVEVDGVDATKNFDADASAAVVTGKITNLDLGDSEVTASVADGSLPDASLTLTNHPQVGPVFSGPHEEPFVCETEEFTVPVVGGDLGAPLDENCSITDRVDYIYRTTANTWASWPTGAVSYPGDMTTTTTSTGDTVPFVVRMETGTVNRAIWHSAVLHDPLAEAPPDVTARPSGWNGRAIFTLGGGCVHGWYRQGDRTGGITNSFMLGQGFAVMSSTLNRFGNNCSDLLAAETAMMVKEKFVESYGPIDHTIAYGASGGSYQGHQITDNYPGIFDGVIAGNSFPDVAFGTVTFITDAWLLDHYFTTNSDTGWTEEQQRAVTGFYTYATAPNVAGGARRIDPEAFCGVVPEEGRYHPDTNPDGARCDVYDHTVNVYGVNPETGFANRPLDNVGVQYGLQALNDGSITREQFLDLNEKIGGFDHDATIVDERTDADVDAVRAAYQTGRLTNGGGGLADVPIIDYRVYRDDLTNGNVHLRYHTFSMRARLIEANGTAANHVSLVEDTRHGSFSTRSPLLRHAITQMDAWLSAIGADPTAHTPIDKVVRNQPADLHEGCNTRDAEADFIAEHLDRDPSGTCEQLYPSASFPREVAGDDVAANVIKCQLKGLDPGDYSITWTPDEWDRLQSIFPTGACDYAQPGVEQQALSDTWLHF